jgi:hypothetical protein
MADQQGSKKRVSEVAEATSRPSALERRGTEAVTEFFVDWQLPSMPE